MLDKERKLIVKKPWFLTSGGFYMAETVFIKEISRIKRVRKELERALDITINITRDGIEIGGKEGFNDYIPIQVLHAIEMGFLVPSALKLKDEGFMFEIMSIKQHARPSRLATIKGRLIGKQGRALETLSELTGCDIKIKDYEVGIIGRTSDIKFAINALTNLMHGSPHSAVYAYLERSRHLREMKEEEEESFSKKL